jgi:hypothetical protein
MLLRLPDADIEIDQKWKNLYGALCFAHVEKTRVNFPPFAYDTPVIPTELREILSKQYRYMDPRLVPTGTQNISVKQYVELTGIEKIQTSVNVYAAHTKTVLFQTPAGPV